MPCLSTGENTEEGLPRLLAPSHFVVFYDQGIKWYRLPINNPAINILVPSVFQHEFQSTVSNFPSWLAHHCFREGAVYVHVLMGLYPELTVLMLDY